MMGMRSAFAFALVVISPGALSAETISTMASVRVCARLRRAALYRRLRAPSSSIRRAVQITTTVRKASHGAHSPTCSIPRTISSPPNLMGERRSGLGSLGPINPKGPIRSGDRIVLMSGDHGSVDFRQYVNDEFISVVAGKDQTPIVRSMQITASARWLFRGIKFQGTKPEAQKYGPTGRAGKPRLARPE